MKVGFDIRPALFNPAGIGRYARELAGALAQMEGGPFLELFAPAWRGHRYPMGDLVEGRYRLHKGWLPARVMNRLHKVPGLDAGRWPANVDVFHWTDYVYPSVTSAASVMTLHDAAFAVDPSYHGRNTSVLLARVRKAISKATIVIVVSETARADAELIGVPPEKVRVVPNGVSPFFRPALTPPALSGYLLTVGTLEPRKNYPRILAALESLWEDDMAPDWVIVGKEGWEHEDFVSRLESSPHRDRIHWVRGATDEELLRYYQGATALLYPSLHEGFGLPVLEAMSCGIPVIVGKGTAPAEVAGNGGMRVDPRNVDSIAAGIEWLLTDDGWRKQAAAVLRLRSEEFAWSKAAEKTLAVYEEAVTIKEQQG